MKGLVEEKEFPGIVEYADVLIRAALAEDMGEGDITTGSIVAVSRRGEAEMIAREEMVVAGLFVAEAVFKKLDGGARFRAVFKDGERVKKGKVIARVSGRLSALLAGERVALNFLQRLSGIATKTSEFVKKTRPYRIKVLDTRKTTPCLRMLEKYAVRAGGGMNHRFGLFDAVLIKDNHIAAAGGVTKAIGLVNKKYEASVPVEVEVKDFGELKEALACGADVIMLDNMGPSKVRQALKLINKRALVEVSGGVNIDNIRDYAATGADFVSVGALTHSARAVDISMEVVWRKRPQRSR